jgi:hypothetical protein
MSCVINEKNYKEFEKVGINTILPRNISLDTRYKKCINTFCAFGLEEAKSVFNTRLNPMKKDTLKQSDVNLFTTYLSRILLTTTDIKAKLDFALGLCNECQKLSEDYNELKSQINNLLNFEENNG